MFNPFYKRKKAHLDEVISAWESLCDYEVGKELSLDEEWKAWRAWLETRDCYWYLIKQGYTRKVALEAIEDAKA